ncbi:Cytosol aminopeptidase, putative [Pediculus humanus corporis]|uniref:Cytosol aminopeptidase n=1 Tax=Pediculus humanus subsp. corporis TaxID=121224 RepID=E0VYD5_PEDHC|nr:Cytosol aminopeptidase, putative [Pediculus humanus corporis]EEB18391.1 Cytosol aminopeptidase, putative [Pediculus humanus corporis]
MLSTFSKDFEAWKEGLVLGAFICGDEMKLSNSAQKFNEITGCKLSDFLSDLSTPMKLGNSVTFTNLDPEYFNVCVVSVGKEEVGYNRIEELDECKENVRIAAGTGARRLRETGVTCINFDGMGHPESAAEGAQLAVWRYQDFKCKDDQLKIAIVDLYGDDDKEAWTRGIFKAEAQNIARKMADCPPNCMTPAVFAQTVIDLLCPCGVQIEVRDKDWLETKKMNAILSVARGSCEPPVFLELGYCGGSLDEKPILLIGKGLTFDSGGLCLNAPRGMDEMRADMAGASVIVGVIKAAASMSLPLNIRGLIPLCENMPSGMALKPGDVIHSMAGKTILVQDTGHEGRLCIADAMTYGQIEYKPRMMIDIATLTTGMKKALGAGATGVFSNDEDIWKELQKAGSITGDRVWRFPLWQHFTDKVVNFPEVDLHNVGLGVGGGPCLGAAFLQEFVCVDWLHLDIAGTGMLSHGEEIPYLPKGRMTGRPTRTIIQFLYQIACLGKGRKYGRNNKKNDFTFMVARSSHASSS